MAAKLARRLQTLILSNRADEACPSTAEPPQICGISAVLRNLRRSAEAMQICGIYADLRSIVEPSSGANPHIMARLRRHATPLETSCKISANPHTTALLC